MYVFYYMVVCDPGFQAISNRRIYIYVCVCVRERESLHVFVFGFVFVRVCFIAIIHWSNLIQIGSNCYGLIFGSIMSENYSY